MSKDITIMYHTEKSFIVTCNKHIKYMVSLKNLGGVFDAHLIDKQTGNKFMGWIFFMNKKEVILNWINNGCPKVDVCQPEEKTATETKSQDIEKQMQQIQSSLDKIWLKLDSFETDLLQIKEELNVLKSTVERKKETEEDYEILNSNLE